MEEAPPPLLPPPVASPTPVIQHAAGHESEQKKAEITAPIPANHEDAKTAQQDVIKLVDLANKPLQASSRTVKTNASDPARRAMQGTSALNQSRQEVSPAPNSLKELGREASADSKVDGIEGSGDEHSQGRRYICH
jgi:hypothetical protein